MNIDENDLLFNNTYIPNPELSGEVKSDFNEEFRKFYEKETSLKKERSLKDSLSMRSVKLDENNDNNSLMNTNKFETKPITASMKSTDTKRKTREVQTFVSVDSRDRDTLLFKKPNEFRIFLGKSFYNVKSIRLSSMEFPNTNAVINSNNNRIFWRNQEDITNDIIDPITNDYPIYDVELRIGSYVTTTLQTEIVKKTNVIRRRNRLGDAHFFIVSLDYETDIVSFTSLILNQLPNNPISTTVETGILTINAPKHGFNTGDNIFLVGAKTLAGIPTSSLNTSHVITVINENTFTIEITTKASQTLMGGGNTLNTGKRAPFQFLFGEKTKTIAPNTGYPFENSSELINTYIQRMDNFNQVIITTKDPHNFVQSFEFLGKTCNIIGSSTSPSIDGLNIITKVISTTSFLVSVSNRLVLESFNNGKIVFDNATMDIQSIFNFNTNTILVRSFTTHNYTPVNTETRIELFNTLSTPNLDGKSTIFTVFNETSFVIYGGLITDGRSSNSSKPIGNIPRNTPLKTNVLNVNNVTLSTNGKVLTITCPNHNLRLNDTFILNNVDTIPIISTTTLKILSIPDSNTIVTQVNLANLISTEFLNASISTGLFEISFPGHNFNKIVSIQNTTGMPAGQTIGNLLLVSTQLPHNFTDGTLVRLSNTNTIPVIDNSYNITKVTETSFTIPFSFPISSPGTNGIFWFNQEFYLYGSENIGEINNRFINGTKNVVRDIVDENTFTFYSQNVFAKSTEIGGGNSLYISSLMHGFNSVQTNTKNGVLNRSINLQGENYAFLCCPQLNTMMNTGNVRNIFARILLDQSPGAMVFSFLSNPKVFDTVPLDKLEALDFSVVNYDGTLYDFNDLDFSFTLEITEVIDATDNFNFSSKRGIIDTA